MLKHIEFKNIDYDKPVDENGHIIPFESRQIKT